MLGERELRTTIEGDGAGGLVEAWATRDPDGRIAIALWNGTIDQTKAGGDSLLDRRVRLTIDGLGPGSVELRHRRVDASHSNIVRTWKRLGEPDWPDDAGWTVLRVADRLEALEPPREVRADEGRLELEIDLPMPAMSLIELVPFGGGDERVAVP